ncbi:Uncharacterised protein [Bordetella trematum]|nr:Uncharacterised protein [Bordetella trematum]
MHDRDVPAHQRGFAGVRDGGGHGGVVIADHHQHAAVARGASRMPMMQGVAGAIHARPLAVPHGEYAIDLAVGACAGLLGAHHGRGREILVDARQETHLMRIQRGLGLPHGHVHAAQRRTPIARDEAGRLQPALAIGAALRQHQAHQRLGAGQENTALLAFQVVGQLVIVIDGRKGRAGAVHESSLVSIMIGARGLGFIALSDREIPIIWNERFVSTSK